MYSLEKADFEIKKTKRDYIVIYKWGEGHSHFREKQGAEMLIELLVQGVVPSKRYFRVAAERILPQDLFNKLRTPNKKEKYINRR